MDNKGIALIPVLLLSAVIGTLVGMSGQYVYDELREKPRPAKIEVEIQAVPKEEGVKV